jgi:hypothetical protein
MTTNSKKNFLIAKTLILFFIAEAISIQKFIPAKYLQCVSIINPFDFALQYKGIVFISIQNIIIPQLKLFNTSTRMLYSNIPSQIQLKTLHYNTIQLLNQFKKKDYTIA